MKLKIAHFEAEDQTTDGNFYLWDRMYYDRIHSASTGSINLKQVSEYFTLDLTLSEMIKIYEHIFGICFQYIPMKLRKELIGGTGQEMTWHEDLRPYALWNEGHSGKFLGYMFFDLYPRDGKYSHAGHYLLQPVRANCHLSLLAC